MLGVPVSIFPILEKWVRKQREGKGMLITTKDSGKSRGREAKGSSSRLKCASEDFFASRERPRPGRATAKSSRVAAPLS